MPPCSISPSRRSLLISALSLANIPNPTPQGFKKDRRRAPIKLLMIGSLAVVQRHGEIAMHTFPPEIDTVFNVGIEDGIPNGAFYARIKPVEAGKDHSTSRDRRWTADDAAGASFELVEREVSPEIWGADPTGRRNSTSALQTAIDYAHLKRVPLALQPAGVYVFDSIRMRRQVVITGASQNQICVHTLASTKDLAVPTLRSSGSDTASIVFPGDAWNAGIVGVAIDLTAKQGTTDGIVFESSRDGSPCRPGHWLREVVVFGGTGRVVSIQKGNAGGIIERCWLRGGAKAESATADYVLYNQGLDWRFIGPLNLSGARTTVLHEAGGSSRYQAIDCFMGQKAGVVVTGEGATFERLQSDLHGAAALEVRNARNLTLIAFKAQSSGSIDGGALVRFAGDHKGCVMIAPIIMSGISSGLYAFAQTGGGVVQIDGARISKKLTTFDPVTQRAWRSRDIVAV